MAFKAFVTRLGGKVEGKSFRIKNKTNITNNDQLKHVNIQRFRERLNLPNVKVRCLKKDFLRTYMDVVPKIFLLPTCSNLFSSK